MAMITGGTITFGRTVQPAQYESKKAEVQLAFSAPDGGAVTEDQISAVFEMAQAKCLEILGLQAAPKKTSVPTTPKPTEASKTGAGVEEAKVVATKTKADLEAEQAAKLAKPKTEAKKPPKAKVVEDDLMGDVDAPANEPVAPDDDLDGDILGPVDSAPEITDEELTSAITKHNAKIKNPVAIKQLIRGMFPSDTKEVVQARSIPQAKRQEFLDKLIAL
jgi:hypothetical protein